MSQHPDMHELLCDYLDGTLDEARRGKVEELLHRDGELRKALATMQEIRGTLRGLPVDKLPQAAAMGLQQELLKRQAAGFYLRSWSLRMAAAIAIAVGGGLVIWAILPTPMAQRPIAMDVRSSGAGGGVPTEMRAMEKGAGPMASKVAADASQQPAALQDEMAWMNQSQNAPAMLVVVANDGGETQREIDKLLATNHILYERTGPTGLDEADAAKSKDDDRVMSKTAGVQAGPAVASAPPADATPARPMAAKAGPQPAAPAMAEPAEMKEENRLADATQQAQMPEAVVQKRQNLAGAQNQMARRDGGGMTQMGLSMRAVANTSQVVARNVTPQQLELIRTSVRDTARRRGAQVIEPAVEPMSRAERQNDIAANTFRQQMPLQVQEQTGQGLAMQQAAPAVQEQTRSMQAQTMPSTQMKQAEAESVRYDVTIIVQEDASSADRTEAAPSTPK